ncbi:MAG TPA: hypothetical protein PLV93_12195, partial [Microthrixaceae bacterium]|nr:hypothetical protein [Microthrixaceae bacterium]
MRSRRLTGIVIGCLGLVAGVIALVADVAALGLAAGVAAVIAGLIALGASAAALDAEQRSRTADTDVAALRTELESVQLALSEERSSH